MPEIASRRHMEAVVRVTECALEQAGMQADEVDAVAATCAPGLIGAVLVGANFGKSLAFSLGKPFIPVHHIRCLLYTSPSPRDRQKSRMPSSA